MFPIARASHTYKHSLSNIITNQLLVYNYMFGGMRGIYSYQRSGLAVNSSGSYTVPVSVIAERNQQIAYSFGVKRAHSKVRKVPAATLLIETYFSTLD